MLSLDAAVQGCGELAIVYPCIRSFLPGTSFGITRSSSGPQGRTALAAEDVRCLLVHASRLQAVASFLPPVTGAGIVSQALVLGEEGAWRQSPITQGRHVVCCTKLHRQYKICDWISAWHAAHLQNLRVPGMPVL